MEEAKARVNVILDMGLSKYKKGKVKEAIQHFEDALDNDTYTSDNITNALISVNFAKILIEVEHFAKADEVLEAAESILSEGETEAQDIAFWQIRYLQAKLYKAEMRGQKALETLQLLSFFLMSLDPEHPLNTC